MGLSYTCSSFTSLADELMIPTYTRKKKNSSKWNFVYETKGNKFQLMNLRTEKGRKLKTEQKTKEKKN